MDLVIYHDTNPVEKQFWHSQNREDRSSWSWISELITTWFCYSHGLRKELNASIIFNNLIMKLKGSEIRYLAPSQRSPLSILYNAFIAYSTNNNRKIQPGVYVNEKNEQIQFEKPLYEFQFIHEKSQFNEINKTLNVNSKGTLLINSNLDDLDPIISPADNYQQALTWLVYVTD